MTGPYQATGNYPVEAQTYSRYLIAKADCWYLREDAAGGPPHLIHYCKMLQNIRMVSDQGPRRDDIKMELCGCDHPSPPEWLVRLAKMLDL